MANTFNLFKQETAENNSKWQGAPKLRPKNGTTVVDILGDYSWTASPKGARKDIPEINFEEYELDLSSLITSALYKLRGGIENVTAFSSEMNTIIDKITKLDSAKGTNVKPIEDTLKSASSNELNPYAGMYAASPTGWTYRAPYLEELNQGINNQWGDDQGNTFNSAGGAALKGIMDTVENYVNTVNLANITAPGSYAEKVKFFNPGTSSSYSVRFPLLNTLDYNDIVKNWELCYLLTYQNLPNRRSVNLLDPPAIYRVTIPGIRQSPVSYISNLSIQHVGNIRNMEINGMMKPIPEAYMVNITFQDLLLNSRNLFKYALDGQQVVATIAPSKAANPVVSSVTPIRTP